MQVRKVSTKLGDDSFVHDVEVTLDTGETIVFTMEDEPRATLLVDVLNRGALGACLEA